MNSDVNLYTDTTNLYDKLQNLRPDYMGAKTALIDLGTKYLIQRKDIILADFCCGTGSNTKMLAERLSVAHSILVDINKEFIEIAKNSKIKAKTIEPIVNDILSVHLSSHADAVISMFAYHHVPDDSKLDYIKKMTEVLKKDGLLFLGEIYIPNKELTIKYYEQLYNSINHKTPELKRFLMETAKSSHFEYKVKKAFADKQLFSANFSLLESKKIYPTDDSFDEDIGTFVEVWKYNG